MARIILHVGLSKTGTTALQHFLFANRTALSEHGITYCHVVRGPNHAQLAVAVADRSTRISEGLGVTNRTDRERLRRRLARRFAGAVRPDSTWIASSEHLDALLRTKKELAALVHFLGDFFDEVSVVAVLRRADYWLPSSYMQSIRSGGSHDLDAAFVWSRRRSLDHHALVKRWQAAVGPGKVQVLPFLESDKHDQRALPARLLQAIGVAHTCTPWTMPSALLNESLDAHTTELLRQINPQLHLSALRITRARRRVQERLSPTQPGLPVALTPEAESALLEWGWLNTGIEASPAATGSDWPSWAQQAAAPVRQRPHVDEREVERALADLRRARLVQERDGWRASAVAELRRQLLRMARR